MPGSKVIANSSEVEMPELPWQMVEKGIKSLREVYMVG